MRKFIIVFLLIVLAAAAAISISACGSTAADKWSGLPGLKVPWGDYEDALYKFTSNGNVTDDMEFIIEKSVLNGVEVFKIQSPMLIKEGQYVTGAVVEADTLKPITSFFTRHPPEQYKDKSMEITGDYRDKLYITAKSSASTQKFEVKLSGECLDNESSLMAIRAMPLAEGFSRVFNDCILATAKSAPFEVKVTGKEKISTPFGEAECYKVEMQYKGLAPAPAISIWYSADDKKTMYKYIQGTTLFELKSVKYEK